MIKLVKGVVNFHQNVLPGLRKQFYQLSQGQYPDALMIACSDSRVAPNLFASTDPGDLFVVRNAGNIIPAFSSEDGKVSGESEAAAIEIALFMLQVKDIIICGHSHCAGMAALLEEEKITPSLKRWVYHAHAAKEKLDAGLAPDASLKLEDQLSQLNVLQQIDHLKSYPGVTEKISTGTLRLHGWWFDIATGNVYAYEPERREFVVMDEEEGERILERLKE